MRRPFALVVAVAAFLAACGPSSLESTSTTLSPTQQDATAAARPQCPNKKCPTTTTSTSTTTFPPLVTTTTTLPPTLPPTTTVAPTTTLAPSTTAATTTVPETSTTLAPTTTTSTSTTTTSTTVAPTTTTSTSTTTVAPTTSTSTTTTTTSTTTTTQSPVGPSGANITTDVPAGYREVINENFDVAAANKAAFDSIYPARNIKRYPDNYPDTRTKQGKADGGYYNAPIDVSGGVLNVRMDVVNGKARVAAIVPLAQPGNGLWGDNAGFIIEERTRFTYTDGFKSAHLTWPASNDSTPDGEIDFAEFDARNNVGVFIHHQGATTGSDQKFFDLGVKPYEWHTYRMEWVMGQRVRIWVDGVLKVDYTTRIPSTPMHIVLQNETWLSSSPVPPTATGLVETDWIRVLVPA